MNASSLANVIALSLLILTYRPLVRHSGAHGNLWFLGWAFIMLSNINHLLDPTSGRMVSLAHLAVGTITVQCAGLLFLMAAGNRQRWLIGRGLLLTLAAGPLVQSFLFFLNTRTAALLLPATVTLYFLPLAFLNTRPRRPARFLLVIASAFGIFGITILAGHAYPFALRTGSLLLIFWSAVYLLVRTSTHRNSALLVTAAGLIAWGVRYPVLHVVRSFYPALELNRNLLHMPEVFVLVGSVLALLEERLTKAERLATHDPLTNLPNRRFLYDRFALALAEARSARTTIACLVIDVDNFKTINDTRGHSAGDELLRSLAIRLGWHISTRDVLARTGGDEFTVMLAGVSNEHYLRFVAEAMMSAASVPVQVDGQPVDVRISMGIALSPDDADEIDDLVRLADDAMYRAKRQGGNILAFAGDVVAEVDEGQRPPTAQILRMTSRSRTALPTSPRAIASER